MGFFKAIWVVFNHNLSRFLNKVPDPQPKRDPPNPFDRLETPLGLKPTGLSDVMAEHFKASAIHFIKNTPLLNIKGDIGEGWFHWLSIGLPDYNEEEINETLADLKEEQLEFTRILVEVSAEQLNDPKNKTLVEAMDKYSMLAVLERKFQPKVRQEEGGGVYIKMLECWYLLPNRSH